MSGHDNPHSPHNDQHGHAHGGEDEIAYGKVVAVGVVSLAIFALSILWAARILSRETEKVEQATGVTHRAGRDRHRRPGSIFRGYAAASLEGGARRAPERLRLGRSQQGRRPRADRTGD